MSSSVLVIVDNTDPDIVYTGPTDRDEPWFNVPITSDPVGPYGQPYNMTLQGQRYSGSITFEFEGTEISAWGGGNTFIATLGAVISPSYQCFVDDVRLDSVDPLLTNLLANQVLCRARNLSRGKHVFRLELAQVTSASHLFYFDRLEYLPLPTTPLQGKNVRVDDRHPSFNWTGDGWLDIYDQARGTRSAGSYVEFFFSGTALTWYGLIPSNGVPSGQAEASYQVDDGEETPFPLYPANSTEFGMPDYFYQVLFKVSSLAQTAHKIRVTHKGDNAKTPLTLDFVVVEQGGPHDASAPDVLNTGSSAGKGASAGAIIGATVASITLVAVLVFAFFVLRRRHMTIKRKALAMSEDTNSEPQPYQPNPLLSQKRPPVIPEVHPQPLGPSPSEKRAVLVATVGSSLPRSGTGSALANVNNVDPTLVSSSRPAASLPSTEILSNPIDSPDTLLRDVPSPSSNISHSSPRIVQHEDSGLRLPGTTGSPVVELPPQYTLT